MDYIIDNIFDEEELIQQRIINLYGMDKIKKIKDYIVKNYYAKDFIQPSFYLCTTLFLVFLCLYIIHLQKSYNVFLIFILALLIMRLFMIFHDLCHRSYFPSDERKTKQDGINFKVARLIDFLCLFQAERWYKTHSTHHHAHGNMNLYDGTRTVYTTTEYNQLSNNEKIIYDTVRTPPFFFLFAPLHIYWIGRFTPLDFYYVIKYVIFLVILFLIGSYKLLFSFLIAQYIGGMFGLMLFHLQHQVNIGYWKKIAENDQLSKENAELLGSSVLKIPPILSFFTNGIEYHNIHHLDPGIPSYNIRKCYEDLVLHQLLYDNKIGYIQSIKSLFHTIYNEKKEKYESSPFYQRLGLQG